MFQSPDSWFAQWQATEQITHNWIKFGTVHVMTDNALILITDGQASLSINSRKKHLHLGNLLAVEKNSVIEILETGNYALTGWIIYFEAYDSSTHSICEWQSSYAAGFQLTHIPEAILANISYDLARNGDSSSQISLITNQYVLYSLLRHLYHQQDDKKLTVEKKLKLSIEYIHTHYNEIITREQLSSTVGISPWHYSRKFKEQYGISLSEYLATYRIYRAQEALLTTSTRSQDIAKSVGFEDAHYFSRRFKAIVGVSPKNYVKSIAQQRICFLSPLHAEIALALNIIPHSVATTASQVPSYQRELFNSYPICSMDMEQYIIDIERIKQHQPTLIIGNILDEEIKNELREIAPVISGLPNDMTSLIKYFGTLFQREEQASSLINESCTNIKTYKQNLANVLQRKPTLIYLRVEHFGYRYIGEKSCEIARLLYQELGFSMPQNLQGKEYRFNDLSLEDLLAANPTFLLLEERIMDYFSSEESMKDLINSIQWNNLDAVKNNRTHYVDTSLWINNCGIFGKPIILQDLYQLLQHKNPIE
ncbi:helix-turn-helix domain-containing protein [Metasolibacillus meyeri]|uniref:Helix-turn-helix domain-containing protein n=1 Tax=Metasolibacillus meyeri TaxID=1071052 RepID=A0AAW9NRU8_9BACL|nr:helix-turn-helix domain-containing protein [Metasolibacillus meyeri]MEC1178655.1 helix-turn-helix domain-containing protein [Metasolibacillus meyeri]